MTLKRTERLLIIATGIVVLLATIGAFWWHTVNIIPALNIPTPKMPYPNAKDYFVAACNAIRDSNKIGFAIEESKRPAGTTSSGPPYDRVYSLAEKEAIIKNNAYALKMLRRGFAYEYREPPARSFSALFPHLSKYREMARLLVLEGQTKAGKGDRGGAMDSYLDAIRLGEEIPRGGVIISKLVGVAIESIGRYSAWKTIDRLDAAQARRAARRMEEMIAHKFPLADVLQEEKWCTLASLVEIFRRLGVSGAASILSIQPNNKLDNITNMLRSLTYSKRRVLFDYERYMNRLIANARLPYGAKPPSPPVPKDPINQLIVISSERMRFVDARCDVQNFLLTVALALRAYRLEHGRYPASLAELVPSYLRKLPDDPFALKGTFGYKRIGDRYILYSIGPDVKDDGGKAAVNLGTSSPQIRYHVDVGSKGDIVAGVNR